MRNKLAKIVVPLICTLFLMGGLGVFLKNKLDEFFESERLVAHTYDVLANVTTARREYNTSDVEYLFFLVNNNDYHARQHFRLAAVAKDNSDTLDQLVQDNPTQRENVIALKRAMKSREDFVEAVILKKRKGLPHPEVGGEDCVKLRTAVDVVFDKINAEEKRLLKDRTEKNNTAVSHIVVALVAFSVISVILTSFILGTIYADIRRKDAMDVFLKQIKQ